MVQHTHTEITVHIILVCCKLFLLCLKLRLNVWKRRRNCDRDTRPGSGWRAKVTTAQHHPLYCMTASLSLSLFRINGKFRLFPFYNSSAEKVWIPAFTVKGTVSWDLLLQVSWIYHLQISKLIFLFRTTVDFHRKVIYHLPASPLLVPKSHFNVISKFSNILVR